MSDAEMFVVIRDLCIARTGSWSANLIADIAAPLRGFGRRSETLKAIKDVCGLSQKRGGKRNQNQFTGTSKQLVPELVPGTSKQLVPKKKKKKQKEKEYIQKLDTSYLAKNAENPQIEAEITAWLEYQAERRGPSFTLRSAKLAVTKIAAAASKHGNEFAVEALEKAIDKNADLGYFSAIVKSGPTGSGLSKKRVQNGAHLGAQQPLHFFAQENGASDYAAAIRERQKLAEDVAHK